MCSLRCFTAFAALGVVLAAAPGRVSAQDRATTAVRACNAFVATIFVAFAFREGGDWTSRGWLRVPPHACKTTKLPASTFSFRAESDWYRDGNHTSRDQWGRGRRFCVADGRFMFHPADRGCAGGQLQKFSTIQVTAANVRLTFGPGSTKISFE